MALHMILGEGAMPKKELQQSLADLWEAAEKDDEEFWFIVQAHAEPSATDQALMEYVAKNSLYFEVLTDDEDSLDKLYEGAQKVHAAKRMNQKVVNLLKANSEEIDANILALFVNTAEDDNADVPLLESLQAAIDAGFKAYGLNDAMAEIDLAAEAQAEEEEAEEEPEEEEAPPAPAKRASKRAAAPAKADTPAADVDYTAEELAALTPEEVKSIATAKGVTGRGKANQIKAILAAAAPAKAAGATKKATRRAPREAEVEPEEEVEQEEEETEAEAVVESMSITSGGVVIVVANGRIVIKPVTLEEAFELVQ